MLLHDLDELEPQDDGGADPAGDDIENESDYGDFDEEIAEQLMQEFERELERAWEPRRTNTSSGSSRSLPSRYAAIW
jgi:hypothetical protein